MRRTVYLLLGALLLSIGALPATPAASSHAATPRAATSAGSAPLGSQSYPIPSGAVFVSPTGSDSASGSQAAPLRTITRALSVAATGGTIVLRGGSYNETVQIFKRVTIQSYPGESVWLDGTTPVTGWVKDGANWRKDGWSVRFDHSPTYTKGAADGTGDWGNLDPAVPMAAHPDQVWIGNTRLTQVKSKTQVASGKFYLDEGTSKLYVGSDPGAGAVASNLQYAINVRADDVTIRGIGIRRYGTSVWQMGSVTLERPGATLENVIISESATTGLSAISGRVTLTKVTAQNNGMLGIHANTADNIRMSSILVRNNNTELFHVGPMAGGLKITKSRGVTVTNSSFVDNNGHGFWEDQSVYNSIFASNDFLRNTGYGLFLEISAKAIVVDSLIMNNKREGLLINNFANAQVWNNTIIGNGRPIWLAQDSRRNTKKSDPAVDQRVPWPDPEMPWQIDYVTLGNNVLGNPKSGNALLVAEDYTYSETAEQMHIVTNGNVYNRASTSAPSWLSIWSRGKAGANTFTTLASMKSTTGQEARSREYTGASVVDANGVLSSSVANEASAIALPLPAAVAAAIGRPAGSTTLGAWTSPSGATPTPTPTATPTTVPPATPTATPTASPTGSNASLAVDTFTRTTTGGWGTADKGGAWSIATGASNFSVGGGVSSLQLKAGEGLKATLPSVSSTSTDAMVYTALDRPVTGSGHQVGLIGRDRGTSEYLVRIRVASSGQVTVWLTRTVSGTSTVLAQSTPSVVLASGNTLALRLQVTGTSPTTLRAKVWQAEKAEPSAWTVTASDSTAQLQTAGGVGVSAAAASNMTNGPLRVFFDDLKVTRP